MSVRVRRWPPRRRRRSTGCVQVALTLAAAGAMCALIAYSYLPH